MLHVLDSLLIGGTERQCLHLFGHLDSRRFACRLLTLRTGGPLLEAARQTGRPVEQVEFSGFRRPRFAIDLLHLARRMRALRVDVVQAYGFYSNVPALLAGRLARVPILVASRRDLGEFLGPAQRFLERLSFRLADRVVVNAEAIRAQLAASRVTIAKKLVLIPTGVDLPSVDAALARPRPPDWGDTKIVGMVAAFRAQKDQATLLRAAKNVLEQHASVVFVLIGDGERRPQVERLARELDIAHAVRFMGGMEPSEALALVRQFDVSVLASCGNEGIPNAVLEAMALSKPVVVSDTGGCREAVREGLTGYRTPVGDSEVMAKRILQLLRDPDERRRMGTAGRAHVENEYSLRGMVARFSELYEELADRSIAVEARRADRS